MRKHVVSFAALMTAGVALLSACGGEVSGAPVPSASVVTGEETAGPDGLRLTSGTAKVNNATPGTGDWAKGGDGTPDTAAKDVAERWVELRATRAGELGTVLVNGAGLTLYRFDKDSNKPPKSTCDGDCAVTWPPLTLAAKGRIFVSGVKKSAVGVVKRADGRLQVTVDGWPVYRFAKDKKPGDVLGQGVGGTWFAVRPDGGKAGGGTTPPPADNGSAAPKAQSAILFDDADFSDSGASQGVAGPGCQDLARPDVTSSIVTGGGSVKLWSEKECKGTAKVITGDVRDLADVGFDDTVASIFFG
ncbi:hypothetical protein [Kibdelosporangium persicum]|nr:hypothetical protein [Kibdelosporangium persicum]